MVHDFIKLHHWNTNERWDGVEVHVNVANIASFGIQLSEQDPNNKEEKSWVVGSCITFIGADDNYIVVQETVNEITALIRRDGG